MRAYMTVLLAAVLLTACQATRADEPIHGNLIVTLKGGLPWSGDDRTDVEFELPVRHGNWPERCWGYAMWFSRGHHEAKMITDLRRDGREIQLSLAVRVHGDPWARGGEAAYEVSLTAGEEGFTGRYEGQFTRNGPKSLNVPPPGRTPVWPDPEARNARPMSLKGKATGRLTAPWPRKIEGVSPPKPGEHPRLVFRKAELTKLKKRATETPEGRAIMARAREVLGSQGPREGDKFTTWPAVGYGFMYRMTGEQKYADRARQIVTETIFENPAGRRGRGVSQDIHHGPRLQGLALTFDLCYGGWEAHFRTRCIDEIARRTRECLSGMFEGGRMSGLNLSWWSNHNAIRIGCAALGALAVHGETDSAGTKLDFSKELEICARELRGHYRWGLGKSGYCIEGGFYKVMTMQRGSVHGIHALATAMGWDVLGDLGDFDLVGYFLEARPGKTPGLAPVVWAVTMGQVPADMRPAVKWFHTRSVGLKGDRSFGIAHGLLAPYALATYPFELTEQHPDKSLRWMAPGENKGHYIFRPTWRNGNDILLTLNLKSETMRASWASARAGPHMHMGLWAFGRKWIDGQYLVKPPRGGINQHHGATITSWSRDDKARTYGMTMNLDRAYMRELQRGAKPRLKPGWQVVNLPYWSKPMLDTGVRATRSMAIDCSGTSGSPLLVATVDQVRVPQSSEAKPEKPEGAQDRKELEALRKKLGLGTLKQRDEGKTVWSLPVPSNAGPVKVEGSRFTVGQADGPTLTGVLVAPGELDGSVMARGEGTYFAVFTVQEGPGPEFAIQGEGLSAVVRAGKRRVRFADGRLALE